MINYKQISVNSLQFLEFRQLYLASFPDSERRELNELQQLMMSQPRFHVEAAIGDDGFEGFVSWWDFDTFIYIEHLAVLPQLRGGGIGGAMVDYLAAHGTNLLLEVDLPTTDIARRRIAFYQRHGLHLWSDVDYVQPPYAEGLPAVPMALMTSEQMSRSALEAAVIVLRHDVYHAC